MELLSILGANSITALCSHKLPIAYFSKLETLYVSNCEKLQNLMSPSVARGILNLRILKIDGCQSMEEVITKDEQQGEENMTNEPLFPVERMSMLGHFCLSKRALEFPFLRVVRIHECPEMKMFVQQGSVSTTSLESVNNDDEVKVVDLNKAMFNSKISCPSLELPSISEANSITAICSNQLPIAYFSKLETLTVSNCGKLQNLMSPSVARDVEIYDCPEMKMFVQQGISVSTPCLKSVNNHRANVDDMNEWVQQRFNPEFFLQLAKRRDMNSQTITKLRLVRCPKCQSVLPELANICVYKCGACDTVLQAKKRKNGPTKNNVHDQNEISSAS